MSFCFLYNVVSENHTVQNSSSGGGGSISSSRSNINVFKKVSICEYVIEDRSFKQAPESVLVSTAWHAYYMSHKTSCIYM